MPHIYHLYCSECGSVIASSLTAFEDKRDALCQFCAEELCMVIDFMFNTRDYFAYWREIISPLKPRPEGQRNSLDIARGWKKLGKQIG